MKTRKHEGVGRLVSSGGTVRGVVLGALVATSLILGLPIEGHTQGRDGVCFCDASGGIGISQLVRAVNVALGRAPCPGVPGSPGATIHGLASSAGVCFCDGDGAISISQLIRAVNIALGNADCPGVGPTATVPATQTSPPTATAPATQTSSPTATPTPLPGPIINLGSSFYDTNSGLEWAKVVGFVEGVDGLSWSASDSLPDGTVFTEYLRGLNESTFAGHRDWRLPTSAGSEFLPTGEEAEVESLVSCTASPCISDVFSSSGVESYWSGSTLLQEPTSAWVAVVDTGAVVADGKTNFHGARAVRDFVRNCDGNADGTTCGPAREGVVSTCDAGECRPCAAIADADPRFVDNGDGTVTDRITCLVWERKTGEFDIGLSVKCEGLGDCSDPHDVNNRYTWSAAGEAFDGGVQSLFLDALNEPGSCFADHCDWRLPAFTGPGGAFGGLRSIADGNLGRACTDPSFGPAAPRLYWSSSESTADPSRASAIDFSDCDGFSQAKIGFAHVRAVRGTSPTSCEGRSNGSTCDEGTDGVVLTCEGGACSQCVPSASPEPRFVDNGDGTITDRRTCLVWEQKTGAVGATVACADLATCPDPHHVSNIYSWTSGTTAFDGTASTLFIDQLNAASGGECFAGHCDWRLPSQEGRNPPMTGATELEDILLMSFPCGNGIDICLDPIFGPTAGNSYWSSSTSAEFPEIAWGVHFGHGGLRADLKTGETFVRAVRGGT